jgi:hypothetical protein
VGLLLVHNVIPWGLSVLSARYGWGAGRPGIGNLSSLILILLGVAGVVWTMALHFVRASARVDQSGLQPDRIRDSINESL